jgi:hypothetical protein
MERTFKMGGRQGRGDPPAFHPHRLDQRNFDTLRDRMQQPDHSGYSVWAAIAGAIFFAAVVTVAYLLKLKGNS